MKWIALATVLLATACTKETPATPVNTAPASEAKKAPASEAKKAPASVAKKAAAGHSRRNAPPIGFDGPVAWQTWEAGMAAAQAANRPVMLMVYADWCPKCRALKPGFKDTELVELSKKLVMIKQDSEEKPAWLNTYAEFGSYVPRVLFLNPDGSVRRELTGPNGRYPHFFAIQALGALKDAMRKAGGS